MLRVGLTGGLGSGKSTAGAMLAGHGAHLLVADEIARAMMEPGQPVYAAIVNRFGAEVVKADGALDRAELARLGFAGGRVEELNAIVHPAVIAREAELAGEIAAGDPDAIAVVESALLFETKYGGQAGWRSRFDRVILVTAPEDLKVARYVDRASGRRVPDAEQVREFEAEARRRLGRQIDDATKAASCDYILSNGGSVAELQAQVDALWPTLAKEARERQKT